MEKTWDCSAMGGVQAIKNVGCGEDAKFPVLVAGNRRPCRCVANGVDGLGWR